MIQQRSRLKRAVRPAFFVMIPPRGTRAETAGETPAVQYRLRLAGGKLVHPGSNGRDHDPG
jgi:hypothetical protein